MPARLEPEVKIVTPLADQPPSDPLVVQALVRSPNRSEIARVEAFLNDTSLGILEAPPYRWATALPRNSQIFFVRVVAHDAAGLEGVAEGSYSTIDAPVFRVGVDAVGLNLAAVARNGNFLSDVRLDELTIKDDGVVQEALRFVRTEAPLRVAMLVDQSGSMSEKMPETIDAIGVFLQELAPGDQVRLMGFNHRIHSYTPFTERLDMVSAFARGIVANGDTALYDALLYGLRQLEEIDKGASTPERRVIFLFTDGEDVQSRNPLGRVIARVREVGVTVFALGQGEALQNRQLREQLEAIADATGGEAYFERNTDKLPEIFTEIAHKMRALYFLSYRPSDSAPGWHDIEIDIARRDVLLRHKAGYFNEQ